MITSFSPRWNASRLWRLTITVVCSALAWGAAVLPAAAADGSGTISVSSTPLIVGAQDGSMSIVYKTTEPMADGAVRMTFSGYLTLPTLEEGPGQIAVTMSTGTIGGLLDSFDSAGSWADNSALVIEDEDTSLLKEGGASVSVSVPLGLGNAHAYTVFDDSQDWTGYTRVGFWVRPSTALSLGALRFIISETSDMSSVSEQYNLPALSANTWTYVTVPLSSSTSSRDAVLSYGFQFPLTVAATYKFDAFSVGPALPIVDGTMVTMPLLGAVSGTVVTVAYGSSEHPFTVPTTAGVYTLDTESRVSSGGTFTFLSSQASLFAYPEAADHLTVEGGASILAGEVIPFTLYAVDLYGNVCSTGTHLFQGMKTVTASGVSTSMKGFQPTLNGSLINEGADVLFTEGATEADALALRVFAAGGSTVGFGVEGLTTEYGTNVSVAAESASEIGFVDRKPGAFVGEPMESLEIYVQDVYGNLVTNEETTIGIGLQSNPGTQPLHADSFEQTTTNGVAVFTGISLNDVADGYVFVATSTDFGSATTTPFSVETSRFLGSVSAGQQYADTLTIPASFASTGTSPYLMYVFASEGDGVVDSVTWNGQTMTYLYSGPSMNGKKIQVYGLSSPDLDGTHDAVVTMQDGAFVFDGSVLLYDGVVGDALDAIGSHGYTASGGEMYTGTVTTQTDNTIGFLVVLSGYSDRFLSAANGAIRRAGEFGVNTGSFAIYERPFENAGTNSLSAYSFEPAGLSYVSFAIPTESP